MRTARIDGCGGRVAQGSGPILPRQSGKAITLTKPTAGVQFARVVAVSDAPAVRSAVLLRLVLINGRRAELEIGDVRNSARYSICWNGARDPADGFGDGVSVRGANRLTQTGGVPSRCWWNRA